MSLEEPEGGPTAPTPMPGGDPDHVEDAGPGEQWPDDVQALIECKAAGMTNEDAAVLLGCSARTVQRRLGLEGVHREIAARRQQLMSDVTGRLVVGSDRAVAVLVELLDGEHEPTRLRAAQSILHRAVAVQRHVDADTELRDRVALLESLTEHVAFATDFNAPASQAAGGAR